MSEVSIYFALLTPLIITIRECYRDLPGLEVPMVLDVFEVP